jgi:hypothetical protein
VLRILLFSTILFHSAIACADEPTQQRVRYSAHVVVLPGEMARSQWCGERGHPRACTRIIGVELAATSTEDRGTWRLKATARFIALIALLDPSRYRHELIHLHDIEVAIESHIEDLEVISFSTRAACEAARIEAAQNFETRVRAFAEASNLERDGYLRP